MNLITNLKLALALARLKSLSRVGREIGLTPSSVSRHLDDLEAHLSVRLFNRTTKGVYVTEEGERFLAEAQDLVERADALMSASERDAHDLTGCLRITAPTRLGERYIAPAVARFLRAHPNVSVELSCTDQYLSLEETGVDLAIRLGRVGKSQNIIKKLASNRRVLVAAPDWVARNGLPRDVDDLNRVDGIFLGEAIKWPLRAPDGTVVTVAPRQRYRARHGDTVGQICEAGCGVALKSLWDIAPALENGTLVHILPGYEQNDPTDIMMVLPTRRFVNRRVRKVMDIIEETFRNFQGPQR